MDDDDHPDFAIAMGDWKHVAPWEKHSVLTLIPLPNQVTFMRDIADQAADRFVDERWRH